MYGLRVVESLTLLWLTIVSDAVFLAALDVKDVTVIGFPNAPGTRVQAPITPAAYSYELIEVHLTSDNKDHSVETTKTWIRKTMVAQGISTLDCLLFEACLVKDVKVADALASWRQMEATPALLPRFRQVNGHMGTAAFGGGTVNSDVHGCGETIARLDTLVAIVATCLIGNKEMLLHDVNCASVCVELEYFRMVNWSIKRAL